MTFRELMTNFEARAVELRERAAVLDSDNPDWYWYRAQSDAFRLAADEVRSQLGQRTDYDHWFNVATERFLALEYVAGCMCAATGHTVAHTIGRRPCDLCFEMYVLPYTESALQVRWGRGPAAVTGLRGVDERGAGSLVSDRDAYEVEARELRLRRATLPSWNPEPMDSDGYRPPLVVGVRSDGRLRDNRNGTTSTGNGRAESAPREESVPVETGDGLCSGCSGGHDDCLCAALDGTEGMASGTVTGRARIGDSQREGDE